MDKFDKIIRLILGWIGELFDVLRFIIQYILGLIWILYSCIRGKNYKKRFAGLNENAKKEIKWILHEFIYYLKEESN